MKSIFASKVFWGAIFSLIAAVTPATQSLIKGEGNPVDHVAFIVIAVAGAAQTITGRVTASEGVYTPRGVWGPDKPSEIRLEIEEEENGPL